MSSSVPPTAPQATKCAKCGTTGTGRFCTECGAPLNSAPCNGCGEILTPGSKFCHRCGLAAGTPAAATSSTSAKSANMATTLPWAVAGIAFLALFAMLAGKGVNARRGSNLDAPSNALPNPALDGPDAGAAPMAGAAGAMGGAGGQAPVRAPDISNMDPTELAERLFNRIMILNDQGKTDSVQFFAPMGIQAYQMVEQEQGHPLDVDQRFDVGRIAEVAGALPFAKAEADTILQQQPNHLLGLILASQVAKLSGNSAAAQDYTQRFSKAKASELAKKLPEYQKHQSDITAGP